jgi:outer membrane protein insertion porin family
MRLLLAFGCLLILCPVSAGATGTTIRSIRFLGERGVSVRELSAQMISREGSLWSGERLTEDLGSLLNFYRRRGYYRAGVRLDSALFTPDSSWVDLTIAIREGDQVKIANVLFKGNTQIPTDQILKGFGTRPGGILDPDLLVRDIDGLLSSYDRIGRPLAKIEVGDVSLSADSASPGLDVTLLIEEGPRVTIDEITVAGNRETRDQVIVRETRLRLHEPYDEEKVKRIAPRLGRLGIFSSVNSPELYLIPGSPAASSNGGAGLLIKVEEGNTNTFDGILGYAPGVKEGEGGAFSGSATVSMHNLFGTARKLDVHWQRDNSESQEIALQYVEPWILDQPVSLTGGFRQRQQDSSYIARSVEVKADLLLTESLTLGGVFSHSVVIPSSTAATQSVSDSRTMTAGIDIQLDTRDDLASPTSGALYRSGYRIGSKSVYGAPAALIPPPVGGSVQKISVDADLYLETVSRQVLAIGLHGRQITTDRIEVSDLYRFGGTNTLRGYRENEFLGSRVAWMNNEYRFLLARRTFFYGFLDAGYYYLPAGVLAPGSPAAPAANPASQQLKYGYGIGIRLATALGNIGVSFAFGEGDSFGEGKLHVGLANEF